MGRGKVKLELIESASDRRATLRKRGVGLRKKAMELATLCGIDVCVVVYGDGDGDTTTATAPEVWPDDPAQAARVVERFRSMPEIEQCRKMMDGASLLRERVGKLQQQVRKAEIDGRERETRILLHDAIAGRLTDLSGLTVQQLVSLGWMAEDRANKVRDRIAELRGQQQQMPSFHQPPPAPAYATTSSTNVSSPPTQGWLMEVIKAGFGDAESESYCYMGNGSYEDGDGGANDGMMRFGNMEYPGASSSHFV